MSEEKEVRENERKTITSQCLFKYLTTWCIVQCSTFYCLCFSFSLSLVWFPSLYIQDWEWIHQYIGHSCKQTSLFDIRRLLSFFSLTLSPVLVRIVCLRQWLFFSFCRKCIDECLIIRRGKYGESSNTLFAYSPNELYVNFRSIDRVYNTFDNEFLSANTFLSTSKNGNIGNCFNDAVWSFEKFPKRFSSSTNEEILHV